MDSTLATKASIFLKLHPKQYLNKFYSEGIRPDGRDFRSCRPLTISPNTIDNADGSSTIKLGSTIVVAGIKLEIAEPSTSYPDRGFLVVNVEVGAICSSRCKPGPPSDVAMVLSDQLHQLLVKSNLIDLNKLCIQEGVAVYCIYLDVVCLAAGGALLDASLMAATTALNNLKIPKAEVLEEEGIIQCDPSLDTYSNFLNEDEKLNLYPLTFAIFDSDKIMADPTTEEEDASQGILTFVVRSDNQTILYTNKTGGIHLDLSTLKESAEQAFQRANFLNSTIAN